MDTIQKMKKFYPLLKETHKVNARNKEIFYQKIFEKKTLAEVADIHSLSRERIRQIVQYIYIRLFKELKLTNVELFKILKPYQNKYAYDINKFFNKHNFSKETKEIFQYYFCHYLYKKRKLLLNGYLYKPQFIKRENKVTKIIVEEKIKEYLDKAIRRLGLPIKKDILIYEIFLEALKEDFIFEKSMILRTINDLLTTKNDKVVKLKKYSAAENVMFYLKNLHNEVSIEQLRLLLKENNTNINMIRIKKVLSEEAKNIVKYRSSYDKKMKYMHYRRFLDQLKAEYHIDSRELKKTFQDLYLELLKTKSNRYITTYWIKLKYKRRHRIFSIFDEYLIKSLLAQKPKIKIKRKFGLFISNNKSKKDVNFSDEIKKILKKKKRITTKSLSLILARKGLSLKYFLGVYLPNYLNLARINKKEYHYLDGKDFISYRDYLSYQEQILRKLEEFKYLDLEKELEELKKKNLKLNICSIEFLKSMTNKAKHAQIKNIVLNEELKKEALNLIKKTLHLKPINQVRLIEKYFKEKYKIEFEPKAIYYWVVNNRKKYLNR